MMDQSIEEGITINDRTSHVPSAAGDRNLPFFSQLPPSLACALSCTPCYATHEGFYIRFSRRLRTPNC